MSSFGSVRPGPPTGKVPTKMGRRKEKARLAKSQRDKDIEAKRLEREARIENRAKKVQVLENLFPVLDEQQMQARLGAVLLEKIKDSITGNTLGCIHIQVQMLKNSNNETILKVLKDFNFFEIKVRHSP